jgi:hypothetical protein
LTPLEFGDAVESFAGMDSLEAVRAEGAEGEPASPALARLPNNGPIFLSAVFRTPKPKKPATIKATTINARNAKRAGGILGDFMLL